MNVSTDGRTDGRMDRQTDRQTDGGALQYLPSRAFGDKKCTFMQTEVAFLRHIVGRAGLACDPGKVSAVRT